jgi:acetyl-CoA synthetase (ADP-forming)
VSQELKHLFYPESIAVIGASHSPADVGYRILENLVGYGYKGRVYPVNPAAEEIMGLECYPSVSTVPGKVDVAIVGVPAEKAIEAVEDAGKAGAKFAVVISSGFKEIGNVELERRLVEAARRHGVRVLGPNVFGYVYTPSRINASLGPCDVIPGSVAILSQSGVLGMALMGYTVSQSVGVSAIVSLGSKSDLGDEEFLEFFEEDPNTKAMLIYLEGVEDGKRFMRTASKVSLSKPIVAIKAGRTEAGARAVASHTGSLAGAATIWSTALKQSGVLQVNSIEEAFDYVKSLAWNPLPRGSNMLVLTNGGGAGVQAADTLAEQGILLREPPADIVRELKAFLPRFASLRNPIDMTGQAPEDFYYRALKAILKHKDVDSVLVLYCETSVADPRSVAERVLEAVEEAEKEGASKPVSVGMVGGRKVEEAINFLNEHNIPAYPTPERAAAALAAPYKYLALRDYVSSRLRFLR